MTEDQLQSEKRSILHHWLIHKEGFSLVALSDNPSTNKELTSHISFVRSQVRHSNNNNNNNDNNIIILLIETTCLCY